MANKPHVHAEVIKAWADGKQIEFSACNPTRNTGWHFCLKNPEWLEYMNYRVKPTETIRYRVALFRSVFNGNPNFPLVTQDADEATGWETTSKVFIEWLTDWIEVDVPVN